MEAYQNTKKCKLIAAAAILLLSHVSTYAYSSEWKVASSTNGFTDKVLHQVSVQSDTGDSSLGLQCSEKGLVLYIDEQRYLSTEVAPIKLRVNKGEVYQGIWGVSADGTIAVSNQRVAERYLPVLSSAEKIIVEVSDYRGVNYASNFSIQYGHEELQHFFDLCQIDVQAIEDKAVRKKAIIQANVDRVAKAKADREALLMTLSFEEKVVLRYMDKVKSKVRGVPSLECITYDLSVLGYLRGDKVEYTNSDLSGALLKHLNSVLSACDDVANDDITLEMRCAARDYEGLLKYTTSMASRVSGSTSHSCAR